MEAFLDGCGLSKYLEVLLENDISEPRFFQGVELDDLVELGITRLSAKKLLRLSKDFYPDDDGGLEPEVSPWKVGDEVEAVWCEDSIWYLATIRKVESCRAFTVEFTEYGNLQRHTAVDLIRAVTPDDELLRSGFLPSWNVGDRVEAVCEEDGSWYSACILLVHSASTFTVEFSRDSNVGQVQKHTDISLIRPCTIEEDVQCLELRQRAASVLRDQAFQSFLVDNSKSQVVHLLQLVRGYPDDPSPSLFVRICELAQQLLAYDAADVEDQLAPRVFDALEAKLCSVICEQQWPEYRASSRFQRVTRRQSLFTDLLFDEFIELCRKDITWKRYEDRNGCRRFMQTYTGGNIGFKATTKAIIAPQKLMYLMDLLTDVTNTPKYDSNIVETRVLESISETSSVVYYRAHARSAAVKDRDFCLARSLTKLPGGGFAVTSRSVTRSDCPEVRGVVRGTLETSGWLVETQGSPEAHQYNVYYVNRVSFGGRVPKSLQKKVGKRRTAEIVESVSQIIAKVAPDLQS